MTQPIVRPDNTPQRNTVLLPLSALKIMIPSTAGMSTTLTLADLTEEERKTGQKTVRPNCMTFNDAEEGEYSIHVPLERYDEALKFFIDSNWEELKKFDIWAYLAKG
ncbi:hypothetical protein E4T43_06443 [Aureobasidium subglaciale]|nr:hypothetical protein E4T43_06443 [Aureobasidium subglaciale]